LALAASSSIDPVIRVVVALLAGMLIGIEREKARAAAAKRRRRSVGVEEIVVKEFPGLRTFSLVSVFASLLGYMWSQGILDAQAMSVMLLVFGLIIVVFSAYRLLAAKMAGITTVVVLLVDFTIGLLSGVGEILLAVSTAVLTTFVLAVKLPAEEIVGKISYEELLWTLELGIVLLVLGPFFMTRTETLYGVSLKSLYLFFVLVLATSYLGYVLARLKGGEGIAYTALFGGIANSEATLASVASLLELKDYNTSFNMTSIVNTVMIARNTLIALAMAAAMTKAGGPSYLTPLVAATLASMPPGLISWLQLTRRLRKIPVQLENPLRLASALKTMVIYLCISIISYTIREAGRGGMILVAILGGFVSSSATIVALYGSGLASYRELAALAVVASAAGSLNKPIYAYLGSREKKSVAGSLVSSVLQAALLAAGYMIAS